MGARRSMFLIVVALTFGTSVAGCSEVERPALTAAPREVLFDAAYGTRAFGAYENVFQGEAGRIVDDPVLGGRRKVARLTSSPLTVDGANVRVQYASPERLEPTGREYWIGISYLFPRSFPRRVSPMHDGIVWADLGDIHGPPFRGSPMFHISVVAPGDGRTRLGWRRTSPYSDWGWIGPYIDDVRGRWIDLVVHVRLSTRKDGFVEIAMNTGSGFRPQTLKGGVRRLYGVTVTPGDSAGRNYHKISHYWPAYLWGNRSVTSYFADHKIGSSFAAVAPRSYR